MWERNKKIALAGAAVGFVLFLGIGLLPSLLYGGYAGLLLAAGIFGTPVQPGLLTKGLVVFGMALGVFGTAAFFAVAGAAAGSGIANLAAFWVGARQAARKQA